VIFENGDSLWQGSLLGQRPTVRLTIALSCDTVAASGQSEG
jgi:hypothetical protein